MANGQLATCDMPGLYVPGRWLDSGRYIASRLSCIDPLEHAAEASEKDLCIPKDVARWAHTKLKFDHNAKQLAVNSRYIMYFLKEGQVRVVHQNGVNRYKLTNSTRASVIDMALVSIAYGRPYALLILDMSPTITIFSSSSGDEDAWDKVLEFVFHEDRPKRVLVHPHNWSNCFVSVHHDGTIWAWSVKRLMSCPAFEMGGRSGCHIVAFNEQVKRAAGSAGSFGPPGFSILSKDDAEDWLFRDATFTPQGFFFAVLTKTGVHIWSITVRDDAPPVLSGERFVAIDAPRSGDLTSLHFLGRIDRKSPIASETADVLVIGANENSDILLYEFHPEKDERVGCLVQAIQFSSPETHFSRFTGCLEVSDRHNTIVFTVKDSGQIFVMPVVEGWNESSGLPISMVQRIGIEDQMHQTCVILGKSMSNPQNERDSTVFVFRVRNLNEKDKPAVDVRVYEISRVKMLEAARLHQEEGLSGGQTTSLLNPSVPELVPLSGPLMERSSPSSGPAQSGQTVPSLPPRGRDGMQTVSDLGKQTPDLKKLFHDHSEMMDQLSNDLSRTLEKTAAQQSQRILAEIQEALSAVPMGEAVSKVKEARENCLRQERDTQSIVKDCFKFWTEHTNSILGSAIQKELVRISDGVVAILAIQLSQSRKFCDALARGVEKSNAIPSKQVIQALSGGGGKGDPSIQDNLGSFLAEALSETLAPVLRQELRAHFEQELVPLISQHMRTILASVHSNMTKCFEGVAAEQEKTVKQLVKDLTPVIQKQLNQVHHIVAARKTNGMANGAAVHNMSDSDLDDLIHTVHSEVIAPLQQRVEELTAQIQKLKEQARRLEQRHQQCIAQTMGAVDSVSAQASSRRTRAVSLDEEFEGQASELIKLFNSGQQQEAFVRAMQYQTQVGHEFDFMGVVCDLVPEPYAWLHSGPDGGCPLSSQVQMLVMLALARQLTYQSIGVEACDMKMTWMTELWIEYNIEDTTVADHASDLCTQMLNALESPEALAQSSHSKIRNLSRQVRKAQEMLRR